MIEQKMKTKFINSVDHAMPTATGSSSPQQVSKYHPQYPRLDLGECLGAVFCVQCVRLCALPERWGGERVWNDHHAEFSRATRCIRAEPL